MIWLGYWETTSRDGQGLIHLLYVRSFFRVDPYPNVHDLWKENHGHFTIPMHAQAQQHQVPTYIVGFVIGTAALCVAVVSPLCGYLVSHFIVHDLRLSAAHFCCKFFTVASFHGTEIHTARWTVVGWRYPDSLWVGTLV